MEMLRNWKIIVYVVAVLFLAIIYFVFDKKSELGNSLILNGNNNLSTTTGSSSTGIETEGTGEYKVERVPVNGGQKITIPDLGRKTVFTALIDSNAKKLIEEKIISLQTNLKKDPSSFAEWIDLGMYMKMAGDYEGALQAWKYVSLVSPNDYISLGNLGDLYGYYLKDIGMAEVSFKSAIELAPTQSYLYIKLANLYKDSFKDIQKAITILDQGLKRIPDDKALAELRNSLN